MNSNLEKIKAFIRKEEGASTIEHALLCGLIGLAIVGGAALLGGAINTNFQNLSTNTAITGGS
jgi:pilus assembly protein Flp/PilA